MCQTYMFPVRYVRIWMLPNDIVFCCFSGGLVSLHLCGRGGLTPLQRLFKAKGGGGALSASCETVLPGKKNRNSDWVKAVAPHPYFPKRNPSDPALTQSRCQVTCSWSIAPYLASPWPRQPLRTLREVPATTCLHSFFSTHLALHSPA